MYSSIINNFARDFELAIRKRVNKRRAKIKKKDDGSVVGLELDEAELITIIETLTKKPKYRLQAIPRHVWCELVMAAIYNNFVDARIYKMVVQTVYKSYLGRECLEYSSDPVKRFKVEYANYKRTVASTRA